MESNPYDSPRQEGEAVQRTPSKWRGWLLGLLGAVAVLAILALLLLPAVRIPREVTRRVQCTNNLKQIGLALHFYADAHGALPPAYTVDAEGNRLHSWRTLILPFLERKDLYDKIDLTKPWDDPANEIAFAAEPHVYRCPSANAPPSHTTYLAVVGPGCCLQPNEPRQLEDDTGSRSFTIVVMETSGVHAVHWMSPFDASPGDVLAFKSASELPHPGGASALFLSGRVGFIQETITTAMLRAMLSIDGGDDGVLKTEAE